MHNQFPTMLIILDGLGISHEKKHNAFFQAHTPHFDAWKNQYFYTTLHAAGTFVGLQENYNGNSEVGHFTLGAGKIIPQTSTMLHKELNKNTLYCNSTLTDVIKNFNPDKNVHLIGMASDGNIHSAIDHAQAFITALAHHGCSKIAVHAFLDGRDAPPQSALSYLKTIQNELDAYQCGTIATIHGRYYAMDRNNNWDRTEESFAILTEQQATWTPYTKHITDSYACNIFDEYIRPIACIENHTIASGDGVIFFNFRPDRAAQLTQKLLELNLGFFITPILYHQSLPTTPLIPSVQHNHGLLEQLAAKGTTIFTIAETEKYAHVTYFFNGHRDISIATETRVLIPSCTTMLPKQDPHMQAEKITDTLITSLQTDPKDFYLVNYANADMVGHSGNLPATIQAIEFLDTQLARLYEEIVIKQQGTIYITADHGNCEMMFDPATGQPCTSHTNNPVPFYMLTHDEKKIQAAQNWEGIGLADVASLIIKNINQ